jgi:hypothetical protein
MYYILLQENYETERSKQDTDDNRKSRKFNL